MTNKNELQTQVKSLVCLGGQGAAPNGGSSLSHHSHELWWIKTTITGLTAISWRKGSQ